MCIEAYGAVDAIALSDRFSINDLYCIVGHTAEARRDPEEKRQEKAQKESTDWLNQNKDEVWSFDATDLVNDDESTDDIFIGDFM